VNHPRSAFGAPPPGGDASGRAKPVRAVRSTRWTLSTIASRVAAAIIGGWIFVWGCVSLGILGLLQAGMPYADARTLAYLLAFLVYLTAFCWSFAAAGSVRVWLVLVGGGAVMSALAWWLARISN
jgi:hypothetical protein